ncbi:hypothetical protein, partial [Streptobacillus moniliformis]|uniref:hypothetical protein n=1 Tax=Streptobacillus moniliformis TaxID=34105 RepID=UPI000A5B7430
MKEINISAFIQLNHTEYTGDDSSLEGPPEATTELWNKLKSKLAIERDKGIYNADTKIPSHIDAYGPGYI